jgi:hypothetical protein
MDQDEKLDYHLYYTRHTLSSRPPSRAESVTSLSELSSNGGEYGNYFGNPLHDPHYPHSIGTGSSTPVVNVEAVLADIDSFFDYNPPRFNAANTTTAITPNNTTTEPSIFNNTPLPSPSISLSQPTPPPLSRIPSTSNSAIFSPTPIHGAIPDLNVLQNAVTPPVEQPPSVVPTQGFFPSLKELAARTVLHIGKPLYVEYIPEAVMDYLQPGARPCALCRKPYVKEWVSSVRVKSFQGHPAVARRVRFCSVSCWKIANEQMEAEESGLITPTPTPGSRTGHLPPVVTPKNEVNPFDDIENVFNLLSLENNLEGTMVCKGGQTYWPVICHSRSDKTRSISASPKLMSLNNSVNSAEPIARTNVCSGRCLGEGVCEW